MARSGRKGVEEARNQLPALLAEAEKGRTTIISRHGRSVAAIVPIGRASSGARQKSLARLAGSGKGLWGRDSLRTLRRLRSEWSR
jgi:prevent-host-death family protein